MHFVVLKRMGGEKLTMFRRISLLKFSRKSQIQLILGKFLALPAPSQNLRPAG
jgi:hypothetical protein